ncbi:hypothetical protein D9M68_773570 [compost metagenome]
MGTVGLLDAQQGGIGVQRLALALGHVLGDVVEHAVHRQQRAPAVAQAHAGIAAVGTGGQAEGGVAGCTVGGGRQQVGNQATLTLEQHVPPAAATATGLVSLCRQAGRTEQPQDQPLVKQSLIHFCAPHGFIEKPPKQLWRQMWNCQTSHRAALPAPAIADVMRPIPVRLPRKPASLVYSG